MNDTAGYYVKTQRGLKGRTYHTKGTINEKVPVYLFECDICGGQGEHKKDCSAKNELLWKVGSLSILCKPESLKILGFFD